MLHEKRLKFAEVVGLKAVQNFDKFLGHFKGSAFEVDSSWAWLEDECQVDVEDSAVVTYHDVGIVAVLQVQQELDEAEARVRFSETGED